MAATSSTSDIVSLNSIEFGTAWHFLPVLIRQGSSARLVELAFRSALAPDLVEILCRILGSPLKFISGGFISSSDAVVEAFVEFMTRTVSWYVPRDAFRVVGLRRGTWNVSLTYVRKRKAPSLDNAAVSRSSSKRRTLLTHERGEGEPMKVEGLPKLLYHLNEIPEKENFDVSSGIDQHSVGMNAFDCSAVELDQSNNLHVSLHDLSCFASRNISYAKEEDTRESNPYITNYAFPYKKVVDFSHEQISLDVGLDANIINDEALQMVTMVEPDFRPILDQSSQANLTLREDCNTLSIELGFNVDIPELHVFERLNAIELDFETSLMDRALNHTAVQQLDHNAQSASSPLACSNQPVLEAIDERSLHSTDDKLITGQLETKETPVDSGSAYFHRKETPILTYEFGDVHNNSAEIEDKQKTFSEPSIKDHIASVGLQNLVGPNIANNNISSTKKQDRNFDDGLIAKQRVKNVCDVNTPSKERVDVFTKATKQNSSDQKLMPNFKQIDHNAQSASSPLACSNQLVLEAINERNLHSTDDKLITGQLETKETLVDSGSAYFHRKETAILTYEFDDVHKNSAAIEFMLRPILTDEPADVAEEKQKTFSESSIKDHIASVGLQSLVGPNIANNNISSTKKQYRNFDDGLIDKKRVKNVCIVNTPCKERVDAFTKATKNSSDQKLMPNFESFIIEEEEGSGGYGTVYKAHRKEDGKVFAVKCPHANANSHHVYNELKMLERFGGRNFVIKYECSFKNGDSECFVLEHVEHDRPEILKKEISLFELQWYGFCMFRALASLHKQGVVHRDVKPGNFLFSRKVNKGYLIDFNLASDLQQKFCRSSKRKTPSATVNPNSLPETKSTSIIHSRKFIDRDFLENAKKETADESKKIVTSKSSKKKAYKGDMGGFPIVERSKHGSQTADGSGVTSTKDQTSTKTPLDWLKQPIPYKGRKELINFVHKAMHNPQNLKTVSNGPSSQRKRIAAPMTKTDTRLLILTPMPLHSGGNAVAGAGMLKNKASGKVKREGPCVGTKGFRAPEVLFKSFHQGCKIDIWSAGVTMLYLMIGRAPFGGDPEQNIKEIAKLRGSEDLWEVAKLHNCESSFPVNLLEVGSLKSMELSDWCGKNSRRAEFHELIPESLFDLVDKCLAVNPRRRFSAEEALMHRFFSPCHESIRKQRLLRKVATEKP